MRNNADNAIYGAEKLIRENSDKIPADLKQEVEGHIASLRGVINEDNAETIRGATDTLNQSVQKIGASMYQQPGAAEPQPDSASDQPGDTPPSEGDSGDVVDGEFKSV